MIRILTSFIILMSGTTLKSYAVSDSVSMATIYFGTGKAGIERSFSDNQFSLDKLDAIFLGMTLGDAIDSVLITVSASSESEPKTETEPAGVDRAAAEVPHNAVTYAEPLLPRWALKTNVLPYAVGALNVAGEYYWGNHYSANLAVVYSPYTIARNYKFRLLTFEPEVRYWLGKHSVGHVVGVYGQVGYYNVAVDGDLRYQDKGGNTPSIGFGVSYGYSLALVRQWRLEFNIGFGYTHFQYDTFYNIPNGALYESAIKNYWGINKAGVCLSYVFNRKR